jgi:hypothetical protein
VKLALVLALSELTRGDPADSAEQVLAVEAAQLLAVQLQAGPVGVAEIQAVVDPAVRPQVLHAGLIQPLPGRRELLGPNQDGEVLHPADGLGERRVVVAGDVEEPDQVVVAEVEEKVAGAGMVAVLHRLDQREPQEVVVEADRLLDVAADQRDMVDPATVVAGRSATGRR